MWKLIKSIIYLAWFLFLIYLLFAETVLGFALILITLVAEWFIKLMKEPMTIQFTTKRKK